MEQTLKQIYNRDELPSGSYWYKTKIAMKIEYNLTVDMCRACFEIRGDQYIDNDIYYLRKTTVNSNIVVYWVYMQRKRDMADIKLTLATDKIKNNHEYIAIYKRVGPHSYTIADIREGLLVIGNIDDYDLNMYMSDSYSGSYRETLIYARVANNKTLLYKKHQLMAVVEETDDDVLLDEMLNLIKDF